MPENYGISYANPEYAVQKFGEEYGTLLSFLYTEMRGGIAYAYEGRLSYLTILSELFIYGFHFQKYIPHTHINTANHLSCMFSHVLPQTIMITGKTLD